MQVIDGLAVTARYSEVLSLGAAAGQEDTAAGLLVSALRHRTAHERASAAAEKPASSAKASSAYSYHPPEQHCRRGMPAACMRRATVDAHGSLPAVKACK